MKQKIHHTRQFIIDNIADHPNDITAFTSGKLAISRQTAFMQLRKLVNDGQIIKTGLTKGVKYELVTTTSEIELPVVKGMSESDVWINMIAPVLPMISDNVKHICDYGFNEMLNNVIDHSNATTTKLIIQQNIYSVAFWITDNGVGIFNKIQRDLKLATPQQSILELAKGKFTSDPANHSGEGIFFTSRMFDKFVIISGTLRFLGHEHDDWMIEAPEKDIHGTNVYMEIARSSKRTTQEVFNIHTEDFGFSKTKIPIRLMQLEGGSLVSRSQAKRLLSRVEKFTDVILDFDDVASIGQAFADEIFRVYRKSHGDVNISCVNAGPNIVRMIQHVTAGIGGVQESLFHT